MIKESSTHRFRSLEYFGGHDEHNSNLKQQLNQSEKSNKFLFKNNQLKSVGAFEKN